MPTIRVVVISADESVPIEVRTIDRGYKAGQAIVGGLIQPVDVERIKATFWCNEEGLLIGLPPNRRATALLWGAAEEHINFTVLVGDIYITGLTDDDGETTSIPDELALGLKMA